MKFNMFGGAKPQPAQMPASQQAPQQQRQPQQFAGGSQQGVNNQPIGAGAPQQQGLYGNQQANGANGVSQAANGTGPQDPANVQAMSGGVQPEQAAGLDAFSSLWQPENSQVATREPLFNVDQAKITEAVGRLPPPQIDQALMQAALGGDQQAFSQVLNQTMQHAMSTSLYLTTQMVNSADGKQHDRFGQMVPNMLNEHLGKGQLRQNFPAAQHKAVAPIIDAVVAQYKRANPTATAEQMSSEVGKYMSAFASAFQQTSSGNQEQSAQQPMEQDWVSYALQQQGGSQGSNNIAMPFLGDLRQL